MPTSPLRLIFAGTPEFAALHLGAIVDSEHTLLAAYTQPDRPAGRGRKLQASPVKQLATAAGVPVYQPPSLKEERAQSELAALNADVIVVVAYGLILPQAVLDIPRFGCLNVHASLLPRWRGAAPIQRAIAAGDSETGITIMQMEAGLDTGPMLASARCPIDGNTTAASLHDRLARMGVPLLLDVLADLPGHLARAVRQDDSLATYAGKINKGEAEIDWGKSAAALDREVRAYNPFPVSYSTLNGERVKVWRARPVAAAADTAPGTILSADREGILVNCGSGVLCIESLQLPGGKVLTAEQVLNARAELFTPGRLFAGPVAGGD